MEDIAFGIGGAVAGLALNPIINKALASQPDSTKSMIGKFLSPAKVAGGGYVAMNKKMDRKLRFAGLGLAAAGSLELAVSYAPEGTFSVSGTGDVFDMIGSPNMLELPIAPSAPLESSAFAGEAILGTYGERVSL